MSIILMQQVGAPPLEQGLLNQAISFFNGASRCMADISVTPLVTNSPMAPALVCYAFSVELYLKLLHAIAFGSASRGHKLNELLSLLPVETQNNLTEIYGSLDFAAHIGAVSEAFVHWRYQHEHESLVINPQILINASTACHRLVRRLRPDLQAFGENNVASCAGQV